MYPEALVNFFWSLVDKSDGPSGCWWFLGRDGSFGYGAISVNGYSTGAHRFSCTLAHGTPAPKHVACHSCDNPRCVNPAHLSWGTHQENMADMAAKGRCSHRKTKYFEQIAHIQSEVFRRRGFHPSFKSIYLVPRPPRY